MHILQLLQLVFLPFLDLFPPVLPSPLLFFRRLLLYLGLADRQLLRRLRSDFLPYCNPPFLAGTLPLLARALLKVIGFRTSF